MLGPLDHIGSALAYFATARRQHKSDLLTARQLAAPLPLPRGLELTWIGTAGFRLAYQGVVVWIDPYVTRQEREDFIRKLGGVARLIDIRWQDAVCRDPRDDKFLHVAVNGEADVLITGDADLLVLHPFHGVRILTPADFLLHPFAE